VVTSLAMKIISSVQIRKAPQINCYEL